MAVIKCKMCGGDIELIDAAHGRCESCDTEVTLPGQLENRQVKMFNRGEHFRSLGEFDRAYAAYENLVGEEPENAEAHWCLVLCRYGILYEKDERRGGYKPTISRMSYESILEDPDYKKALEVSDAQTAQLYRAEAKRIARIQDRYREIAVNEPAYDVFICFKAEDAGGQRTRSSVRAQEIYEELAAAGLRVFFSRITLEDKLSVEYEPYIYAALQSASLMIVVVAEDEEQLLAPWVKNEWSRFLAMKERNPNKSLLTAFQDVSPANFPMELGSVQGVALGKPGAKYEIVQAAKRIVGVGAKQTIVTGTLDSSLNAKHKRMAQALLDEQFDEAYGVAEEILDVNATDAEAYLCRLLVKYKAKNLEALKAYEADWEADSDFKRAVSYADEALQKSIKEFLRTNPLELRYLYADKLYEEGHYEHAAEEYEQLDDYKDSAKRYRQALRQQKQKEYEAEYQKNITEAEVTKRMWRQDAKAMKQWSQLKSKCRHRREVFDVWQGIGFVEMTVIAAAIIGWGLYFMLYVREDYFESAFTMQQAAVGIILWILPWTVGKFRRGEKSKVFYLIVSAVIGGLCVEGLQDTFYEPLIWLMMGIFTLVVSTRHVPKYTKSRKGVHALHKEEKYEKTVILPLRQEVLESINREYKQKIEELQEDEA